MEAASTQMPTLSIHSIIEDPLPKLSTSTVQLEGDGNFHVTLLNFSFKEIMSTPCQRGRS